MHPSQIEALSCEDMSLTDAYTSTPVAWGPNGTRTVVLRTIRGILASNTGITTISLYFVNTDNPEAHTPVYTCDVVNDGFAVSLDEWPWYFPEESPDTHEIFVRLKGNQAGQTASVSNMTLTVNG